MSEQELTFNANGTATFSLGSIKLTRAADGTWTDPDGKVCDSPLSDSWIERRHEWHPGPPDVLLPGMLLEIDGDYILLGSDVRLSFSAWTRATRWRRLIRLPNGGSRRFDRG